MSIDKTAINNLKEACYSMSYGNGFWDEEPNIGEKIALIHSELSEALEEVRSGNAPTDVYYNEDKPEKPEGLPIELADAIVRIMDLCGHYRIDIAGALDVKMRYNATRPYKHGRAF